jgi:hypothetical protein
VANVFTYLKPNARMLSWASQRRYELQKQIEAFKEEDGLMAELEAKYKTLNCPACYGEGTVMRLIKGCECDGPRSHQCDACGGTGEPSSPMGKADVP